MTPASPDIAQPPLTRPPGSISLPRIAGIPIYLHWSCVLGGIVLSSFGGFSPHLILPLIVACILVVLVHEAGHALTARLLGLRVYAIGLKGLGGTCFVASPRRARDAALVFSAGLLAQALLFAGALLARRHTSPVEGGALDCFLVAFTYGNAVLFACALLPGTSGSGLQSDGRVLLGLAHDRWHGRTYVAATMPGLNAADQSPVFAPATSLLSMAALVPPSFSNGVQILNDSTTPFEFVMAMFMRHLGYSARQAAAATVEIHNRGGMLVPLASMAEAERVAAAIDGDARAAGHAFACRPVGVGVGAKH